jgi:hypothetical protein
MRNMNVPWETVTIGEHKPKLLATSLKNKAKGAHPTKLILRKAATYLPAHTKQRLTRQL